VGWNCNAHRGIVTDCNQINELDVKQPRDSCHKLSEDSSWPELVVVGMVKCSSKDQFVKVSRLACSRHLWLHGSPN